MSTQLDALEEGLKMMKLPMKDLPPEALAYSKHLCNQVGMCCETLLTAWVVYCQIVLKMKCNDDLYFPNQDAIDFFKNLGYE